MGYYSSPQERRHIQHCIKYIIDFDQHILPILQENELLDEFNHIKNVSENRTD
jgi:hypothetical protein